MPRPRTIGGALPGQACRCNEASQPALIGIKLHRHTFSTSLSIMTMTTTKDVASRRNNNFVAESDYKAAVAAMEARFDSFQIRPTVEHPQVAQALITAAKPSLQANLARVVQVISDEAYHVYKHQMSSEQEEDSKENETANKNDASDAIDYRFDESELIDQSTLEKVQVLREQVREQSASITALRESLMERSVRLADRQLQLWTQQYPDKSEEFKSETTDNASQQQVVQDMAATVRTLLETLRRTKSRVPKALSSLQEPTLAIQQNQKTDASGILQPKVSDTAMMLESALENEPVNIAYSELVR